MTPSVGSDALPTQINLMGNFFLFRLGDCIACSFSNKPAESVPEILELGGRRYSRSEQIPIFDHLLTAERKLAGFCLHALDYAPTLKKSRLLRVSNIFDEASDWDIFAVVLNGKVPGEVHNDCCACIGADVYFDGIDEHVIAVPDAWNHHWDGLAFEVSKTDILFV